ncbi:stage V sporulation protein AA [Virgibacillus dakarensis]|uniref:Stage V sporulation protein AA n=1 Tax=Lentibacillus populi TaxID=1827502 RepID=A0A9W5TV50_9BACI|nr:MULTISPECIES: stage V sporulation protein AA [Bacillaceae]MBT2214321.1 stage V sporulation protein AA [Virgibacillus dakarensis]MTW84998.1 stage V sporulation protein AA [Virgibacillus dakarensis]GGB33922.1 stage V sporulation protein AA [Lentibacillus populi]
MTDIVYIRMKKSIEITELQTIHLQDIAYLSTSSEHKQEMEETVLYRITKKDRNIVIIDSFIIIDHLRKLFPGLEFQLVGPAQTIIRIVERKKSPSILLAAFVWVLLFIGAAMTIMNFHYDVSMQEVQQKLHYILTGEHNKYPLWIQIPYSFGLGIGMLLFFNHWFKKRFNEEPSPLEIEIFNYQQDLNQYVIHYENELNDKS